MFADLLSDCPWDNRPHRGLTTLASFALQAVGVGVLLLLPLLYTEALPQLQFMVDLVAPSAPPAPAPAPVHPTAANASNLLPDGRIMEIRRIPTVTQILTDDVAPPRNGAEIGVPGGTADRWTDNPVMNSIVQIPVGVVPALRPIPNAHPHASPA